MSKTQKVHCNIMQFNVVYFPRIIIFTNLVNNNRITANVRFNHSLFTQTTRSVLSRDSNADKRSRLSAKISGKLNC